MILLLACTQPVHIDPGQNGNNKPGDDTGEPTLDGDLDITDVDDMKGFCDDFTVLDGDLLIGGEVTSVEELSCLVEVTGDIVVQEDGALEELALPNLVLLGDDLTVLNNQVLRVIDFPVLTHVDDDIYVLDADGLEAIRMPSLVRAGDDLKLFYNGGLSELDLDSLEEVYGYLHFRANAELVTLSMPALKHSDIDFIIEDHTLLETVSLPAFVDSRADVRMSNNVALTTVDLSAFVEAEMGLTFGRNAIPSFSLPVLESVGGNFTVTENDSIESFSAPALVSIGAGLELSQNESLVEPDLSALESVGYATLRGNGFEHVDGLAALRTVEQTLAITDNSQLVRLDGLHGVESVGGDLEVRANRVLDSSEVDALVEAIGEDNIAGSVSRD